MEEFRRVGRQSHRRVDILTCARAPKKNLETKVETTASLKDERRVCVSIRASHDVRCIDRLGYMGRVVNKVDIVCTWLKVCVCVCVCVSERLQAA